MRTANNLAKIRRTGLNAFGEPYTGNAIGGVKNRREFSGGSGPLSMRGPQAMGEAAAVEKEAAAEATARQMARDAGRARAQAEAKPAAQVSPVSAPKPQPQQGGWFNGLVQGGQKAMHTGLAAARRQRGEQATLDRMKGRRKANREREADYAA